MARSNVPKFGNWENDDNVPYTVYFEKARKNKGGKMINPNDPMENPDMFPDADPPPPAASAPAANPRPRPDEPNGRGAAAAGSAPAANLRPRPDEPNGRGAAGARPDRRVSKEEDADFHNSSESSHAGRGQRAARPARASAGSEQSFERSPLHPHHQAKLTGGSEQSFERSPLHPYHQAKLTGGRGTGSPAWEGRSHDGSHGTPGRSKLRPTSRGDESPDKGAAVPRFGEWDENDPQSAENFTHIFNKVREERNTGAGNISGTPRHPSYGTPGRQKDQPKKCCCGWW